MMSEAGSGGLGRRGSGSGGRSPGRSGSGLGREEGDEEEEEDTSAMKGSYSELIQRLSPSIQELFNEDGTAKMELPTVSEVEETDTLDSSAHIYEDYGTDLSGVFAVRLDGLNTELAKMMSSRMLKNEERTAVASIKLNMLVVELTSTLDVHRRARKQVSQAATLAAQNGDHVMRLERVRTFIKKILRLIETLRSIERKASVELVDGDLSKAHNLCKKYDEVITAEPLLSSHYQCMRNTSERIAHVAVESLRKLHGSLQPICFTFDPDAIEKVVVAYYELRAGSELLMRLMVEYNEALMNASVESQERKELRRSKSGKGTGADRGEPVGEKLVRTMETMIDVLISFHKMITSFQTDKDDDFASFKQMLGESMDLDRKDVLSTAVVQLEKVLDDNKDRVTALKPPSLTTPYTVASKFQRFCDTFLKSRAEEQSPRKVLSTLERLSVGSFRNMHQQNIDLFAVMLRNETWESARVSNQDLIVIRDALSSPLYEQSEVDNEDMEEHLRNGTNPIRELLRRSASAKALKGQEKPKATVPNGLDDLDDMDWAGSKAYTPTSLAALRWLGRYIQIGRSLAPTAAIVGEAVLELFLLYLYHIVELCSRRRLATKGLDRIATVDSFLSRSEKAKMAKLRSRYSRFASQASAAVNESLLPMYKLCVAIESVWTLSVMIEPLVKRLREQLQSKGDLDAKFEILEMTWYLTEPLRRACYMLFSYDVSTGLAKAVSTNNYELPDKEQESLKVSSFVETASRKISQAMSQPLLPVSAERLSEQICRAVMRSYMEGIASVERCSSSGRALMLVDFRNLESALEKATGLHPVPDADRVEQYVKAYYLNDMELVAWVSANCVKYKLTIKHVTTLGECGPGRSMNATEKYRLREKLVHECSKTSTKAPTSSKKDQLSGSDEEPVSAALPKRLMDEQKSSKPPSLQEKTGSTLSLPGLEQRESSLKDLKEAARDSDAVSVEKQEKDSRNQEAQEDGTTVLEPAKIDKAKDGALEDSKPGSSATEDNTASTVSVPWLAERENSPKDLKEIVRDSDVAPVEKQEEKDSGSQEAQEDGTAGLESAKIGKAEDGGFEESNPGSSAAEDNAANRKLETQSPSGTPAVSASATANDNGDSETPAHTEPTATANLLNETAKSSPAPEDGTADLGPANVGKAGDGDFDVSKPASSPAEDDAADSKLETQSPSGTSGMSASTATNHKGDSETSAHTKPTSAVDLLDETTKSSTAVLQGSSEESVGTGNAAKAVPEEPPSATGEDAVNHERHPKETGTGDDQQDRTVHNGAQTEVISSAKDPEELKKSSAGDNTGRNSSEQEEKHAPETKPDNDR